MHPSLRPWRPCLEFFRKPLPSRSKLGSYFAELTVLSSARAGGHELLCCVKPGKGRLPFPEWLANARNVEPVKDDASGVTALAARSVLYWLVSEGRRDGRGRAAVEALPEKRKPSIGLSFRIYLGE